LSLRRIGILGEEFNFVFGGGDVWERIWDVFPGE
jgi:hypothetical protein